LPYAESNSLHLPLNGTDAHCLFHLHLIPFSDFETIVPWIANINNEWEDPPISQEIHQILQPENTKVLCFNDIHGQL
jgi:hypothetical protein